MGEHICKWFELFIERTNVPSCANAIDRVRIIMYGQNSTQSSHVVEEFSNTTHLPQTNSLVKTNDIINIRPLNNPQPPLSPFSSVVIINESNKIPISAVQDFAQLNVNPLTGKTHLVREQDILNLLKKFPQLGQHFKINSGVVNSPEQFTLIHFTNDHSTDGSSSSSVPNNGPDYRSRWGPSAAFGLIGVGLVYCVLDDWYTNPDSMMLPLQWIGVHIVLKEFKDIVTPNWRNPSESFLCQVTNDAHDQDIPPSWTSATTKPVVQRHQPYGLSRHSIAAKSFRVPADVPNNFSKWPVEKDVLQLKELERNINKNPWLNYIENSVDVQNLRPCIEKNFTIKNTKKNICFISLFSLYTTIWTSPIILSLLIITVFFLFFLILKYFLKITPTSNQYVLTLRTYINILNKWPVEKITPILAQLNNINNLVLKNPWKIFGLAVTLFFIRIIFNIWFQTTIFNYLILFPIFLISIRGLAELLFLIELIKITHQRSKQLFLYNPFYYSYYFNKDFIKYYGFYFAYYVQIFLWSYAFVLSFFLRYCLTINLALALFHIVEHNWVFEFLIYVIAFIKHSLIL